MMIGVGQHSRQHCAVAHVQMPVVGTGERQGIDRNSGGSHGVKLTNPAQQQH
jgi:hypothetical protein